MTESLLNNIPYSVCRSRRAKRIRLTVGGDGQVLVTIPAWVSEQVGHNFFLTKKDWVISRLNRKSLLNNTSRDYWGSSADFNYHKAKAQVVFGEKVRYWNQFYNYPHKKITIKNQKTRWGSCSRSGNLNFNYKLLFLPEGMLDYVVVHELCHLKEFNHSARFWALVAETMPNYKLIRRQFKQMTV